MRLILKLLLAMWIQPAFGKSLLTPTITYVDATGPVIRVGFNVALSGNYVTGGDTLNLSAAAADPLYIGMVPAIEALGAPLDLDVWDAGGDITYILAAVIGATAATCKLKIASALGSEIAAAAYSGNSGLTPGKIIGEAVFNKL